MSLSLMIGSHTVCKIVTGNLAWLMEWVCFYSCLNHAENVVELLLSPTQSDCKSDLYGKMTPGFFIQKLAELLWTKV